MYMYLLKDPAVPQQPTRNLLAIGTVPPYLLASSRGKSGGKERFLHPPIHALLLPFAHRTRTVSNYSPEPPVAVTVVLSRAAANSCTAGLETEGA